MISTANQNLFLDKYMYNLIRRMYMILKGEHITAFRNNGHRSNGAKQAKPRIECQCDKCGKIFIEIAEVFNKRVSLINEEWCGACARSPMCRLAGLAGLYDKSGNIKPNSGRFTTEKVKALNEDEYKIYCEHRKNIIRKFHEELNKDEELKQKHYEKVFKNSKIGYISKGQREVFELLEDDGFLLECPIGECKCDIANLEKKIIIEYYGDFWHANPRLFNPDDWITLIGMSAQEKWDRDRHRNFKLRSLGYHIIIIWENEWKNDREKVFNKLKTFMDDNWIFPKWEKLETKRKWMTNFNLKKWTTVLNDEVNKFLSDGWILGRFELENI